MLQFEQSSHLEAHHYKNAAGHSSMSILPLSGHGRTEHPDCKWFTNRFLAALYHKDVDLEPLPLD
jgi:hypothetical protein